MGYWKWEKTGGIEFVTLPEWKAEGVVIAFSSRWGGTSMPPFDSLNLGLHVGDKKENVLANRRRYLRIFNGDLNNMVCCEQVHGSRVAVVGQEHSGRGALDTGTALSGYDAMVTNTAGIFLGSFFADCLPVYFFDPYTRTVAIAHSGWKGTMGRIAVNTVEKMKQSFGCMPADLRVFIGPGIGKCCFQVNEDIFLQVKEKFAPAAGIISINENGYAWELKATNQWLLIEAGVKKENIITCDICTSCNTDIFYSYRREKGNTGRMGALIGLLR